MPVDGGTRSTKTRTVRLNKMLVASDRKLRTAFDDLALPKISCV